MGQFANQFSIVRILRIDGIGSEALALCVQAVAGVKVVIGYFGHSFVKYGGILLRMLDLADLISILKIVERSKR